MARSHSNPWIVPAIGAVAAGTVWLGGAQLASQQSSPVSHQEIYGQEGFPYAQHKPPIKWDGPRRLQPQAQNVRLVGWSDLNGRADGEQIDGAVINGRDYIFYGHYWSQGVSIVDVTDPKKPEVVSFIKNRDPMGHYTKVLVNHKNIMMLPLGTLTELDDAKQKPIKEHGVSFYDVNDPKNPKFLSFYRTAPGSIINKGVHSCWFVDDYAYLSTPAEGYSGRIFLILDVRDPRNPKEVGRWWMPGQHTAGGEKFEPGFEHASLHGAQANRDGTLGFYCARPDPPGGMVILDIRDKAKPAFLSRLDLSPPMIDDYFAIHNVVTFDSRGLLAMLDEGSGNNLLKPEKTGWIVDVKDPKNPVILSVLQTPQDVDRRHPVRFGIHNAHENQPGSLIDDYMLYVSWFRAGMRIFDLSDPKHPVEAGYFRPPDPKYRIDDTTWNGTEGDPDGSELSSLNHVYVDQRGLIYTSGYNDGLYILEYTGPRPQGSRAALETARRQREQQIAASAQAQRQ
ncbi:MAG: hypothetical protein HYU53_02625 [Acidobacteria bacterium]|nr:hypothetical protein [Acidobacteriota bacterium]